MEIDPKERYLIMRQTTNAAIEGFKKNYENSIDDDQRKLLVDFMMFLYSIQTTQDIAKRIVKQKGVQNGQ